jgi:hypothetical protein
MLLNITISFSKVLLQVCSMGRPDSTVVHD